MKESHTGEKLYNVLRHFLFTPFHFAPFHVHAVPFRDCALS